MKTKPEPKTIEELAALYDRNPRTIRKWRDAGHPIHDEKKMLEIMQNFRTSGGRDVSPEMKELQIEKLRLQCVAIEFDTDVKKRRYVLLDDVKNDFTAIGAALATELDTLSVELPTMLFGKDEAAMQKMIRQSTRALRQRISSKFAG